MKSDRTLEPDERRLLELVISNLNRACEVSGDFVISANAGKMPSAEALHKLEQALRGSDSALTYLLERHKGCPPPVHG